MADMDAPNLEPEDGDSPDNQDLTDLTENAPILSQPANKSTEAKLRPFLRIYGQTGYVARACEAAGISRELHYHKLETDEGYRRAFERAQDVAGDFLEGAVFERAFNGVRRQLFHQGEPVMLDGQYVYETEYSDHLAALLLKRFKREAYKERIEQQISGEITVVERIGTARKRLLEMNRSASDPKDLAG